MSHYRRILVFSWENLDNAQTAYNKLIARVAALKDETAPLDQAACDALNEKFVAALDNDLNSSLAVTALYDVLKADTNDFTKLKLIGDFDTVLGLDLIKKADAKRQADRAAAQAAPTQGDVLFDGCEPDEKVKALALERAAAKKAKDFTRADALRGEIAALGYAIIDTPQGPKITE